MENVKRVFRLIVLVVLGLFCWYVLPQHDVVRVTGTEIIRMDFSTINRPFFAQADSGTNEYETRDVRLINTMKQRTILFGFIPLSGEKVMVYRNEDTGWIWPPYFKFDSADLQAEAAALAQKGNDGTENWAIMTHYGWRNRFFSIYPNAVGLKPIPGPDVTIIPWFNIFFFSFLIVAWLFIRALWRQFRQRSIDPALEDVSETWDLIDDKADEARGRMRRWFGRK